MKLKKIIPSLLVLLLLPSCGVLEEMKDLDRLEKIYYSNKYVFASAHSLFSLKYSFNVFDKIKDTISDLRKVDRCQIEIKGCEQTYNNLIYLVRINEDLQDIFYIVSFNVETYNIEVIEKIDISSFANRGLININYQYDYILCYTLNSNENEVIFEFLYSAQKNTGFKDENLIVKYNSINKTIAFEKKLSSDNYQQDLINDRYYVLNFSNDDEPYITFGNLECSWTINEEILLNDQNYKCIRETIYQEQIMKYYHRIINKELYIIAYYEGVGFVSHDSTKDTAHLVFKVDITCKDVEYIGYLPKYNYLLGVFNKNE